MATLTSGYKGEMCLMNSKLHTPIFFKFRFFIRTAWRKTTFIIVFDFLFFNFFIIFFYFFRLFFRLLILYKTYFFGFINDESSLKDNYLKFFNLFFSFLFNFLLNLLFLFFFNFRFFNFFIMIDFIFENFFRCLIFVKLSK